MESANLAPGLLLAMPQLADPNFSRAVVLMIEHSEQGSFGLVINHPSPIKASELLAATRKALVDCAAEIAPDYRQQVETALREVELAAATENPDTKIGDTRQLKQ